MSTTMKQCAIALLGSGGAGIAAAGEILLEAGRRAGYRGRLSRSFGPQIRVGETAAFIVLGTDRELPPPTRFDLVAALDWNNADRFSAELPCGAATVVAAEAGAGTPPACVGAVAVALALRERAKASGVRENLQLLAVVAGWLGLPLTDLLAAIEARFARPLDEDARSLLAELNRSERPAGFAPLAPGEPGAEFWSLSGNEATGLGLLQGGIRFAAAYPITPATDLLEWLAPRLEGLGGRLVQAEDELAAINMAVGASFGGIPAMTATSGPGLSLMHEGIGLAIGAELPLVVVDVQRGGPSTGLPTKSEQADLVAALFGPHGDAPHVVLAPTGVVDCAPTAAWAVELAERLQVPVLIQSEQALGQTRVVCDPLALPPAAAARRAPVSGNAPYARYADTPDGVSPISHPGDPGKRYVADGLEHLEDGTPSTAPGAHAVQVAKRRRKLERHDFGERIFERFATGPDPTLAIVVCGSLFAPARLAARRLAAEGLATLVLAVRVLAPARPEALARALAGVDRVLVVEQNDGAQLFRYLRGWWSLSEVAGSLARPGPIAISADEIVAAARPAHRRCA